MSSDHLSDDQIQAYLDSQEIIDKELIEEHLKYCSSCQKNITFYRELYKSLDYDLMPSLPKNFAKQVISGISGTEDSRWYKFESGFIISFFLISIAAVFYFINPLPQLLELGSSIISNTGGFISKWLSVLNGNIPLIVVAFVIFLLIEVVDKKILRPKL
jgi:hypothetical protein